MTRKNSYETCIAAIEKIVITKDSHPRIPAHAYLQEACNLYVWCQDDIRELESVGLSRNVIDELPVKIEAAQEAHTIWNEGKDSRGPARVHFEEKLAAARKLKTQLTQAFHFAFRKDRALNASVSKMAKTASYPALIQSLNNLAVLGRDNLSLLQQINFDASLLDDAAALSTTLSRALSAQKVEKEAVTELKQIRDKAFVYLKMSVDQIRVAGVYAFSSNKERRQGYVSDYWKKRNKIMKKRADKDSENPIQV